MEVMSEPHPAPEPRSRGDRPSGRPDGLPCPHLYRLSPALGARLVGAALLVLAVLVLVTTVVVGTTGLPSDVLVAVSAGGLLAVLGLGLWLRTRAHVLRVDEDGYAVRLVRGAGRRVARWTEVSEAATASPHGVPCFVMHLRDGAITTIPVQALAVDGDRFVREMQRRLAAGQRYRPLG